MGICVIESVWLEPFLLRMSLNIMLNMKLLYLGGRKEMPLDDDTHSWPVRPVATNRDRQCVYFYILHRRTALEGPDNHPLGSPMISDDLRRSP